MYTSHTSKENSFKIGPAVHRKPTANPLLTHREQIMWKRAQYGGGTNPATYFAGVKYIPGNGPNHRLGKRQCQK